MRRRLRNRGRHGDLAFRRIAAKDIAGKQAKARAYRVLAAAWQGDLGDDPGWILPDFNRAIATLDSIGRNLGGLYMGVVNVISATTGLQFIAITTASAKGSILIAIFFRE